MTGSTTMVYETSSLETTAVSTVKFTSGNTELIIDNLTSEDHLLCRCHYCKLQFLIILIKTIFNFHRLSISAQYLSIQFCAKYDFKFVKFLGTVEPYLVNETTEATTESVTDSSTEGETGSSTESATEYTTEFVTEIETEIVTEEEITTGTSAPLTETSTSGQKKNSSSLY